jgi:hypothetical protein
MRRYAAWCRQPDDSQGPREDPIVKGVQRPGGISAEDVADWKVPAGDGVSGCMEQTRACAEAATAGRLGRYLGIPKPPERWVQDEVTNAMNRSTPPLALTALLGGLLSSLGGCRNHDKAPPAQPPLVDAAPRTPPTDAAGPALARTRRYARASSVTAHPTSRVCMSTRRAATAGRPSQAADESPFDGGSRSITRRTTLSHASRPSDRSLASTSATTGPPATGCSAQPPSAPRSSTRWLRISATSPA